MDFATWFKSWLARHPLKTPSDDVQAGYTAQVMARIRARQPDPAPRWLAWPSLSLGAALAAAAVLLVVGRMPSRGLPAAPGMVLAESPSTDEQWVQETLQLLEQVDGRDTDPAGAVIPETDSDVLLEELQLFDESELASTS